MCEWWYYINIRFIAKFKLWHANYTESAFQIVCVYLFICTYVVLIIQSRVSTTWLLFQHRSWWHHCIFFTMCYWSHSTPYRTLMQPCSIPTWWLIAPDIEIDRDKPSFVPCKPRCGLSSVQVDLVWNLVCHATSTPLIPVVVSRLWIRKSIFIQNIDPWIINSIWLHPQQSYSYSSCAGRPRASELSCSQSRFCVCSSSWSHALCNRA